MVRRGLAYAEPTCCVRLGVKIDDQNSLPLLDKGCGKTDGGRRLPYSALLVAYGEDRHLGSPVTRETPAEIGVKMGAQGECFVPLTLPEVRLADYLPAALRNRPEREPVKTL